MRMILAALTFWVPVYTLIWIACGFLGIVQGMSPSTIDAMDALFAFTVIVCIALMPFYLVKVWRNDTIESKAAWVLAILASPLVFMPVYVIRYELKAKPN